MAELSHNGLRTYSIDLKSCCKLRFIYFSFIG